MREWYQNEPQGNWLSKREQDSADLRCLFNVSMLDCMRGHSQIMYNSTKFYEEEDNDDYYDDYNDKFSSRNLFTSQWTKSQAD